MKNGMIRIGMFEAYLERMLIRGLKVAYISYFTRTLQEAKAIASTMCTTEQNTIWLNNNGPEKRYNVVGTYKAYYVPIMRGKERFYHGVILNAAIGNELFVSKEETAGEELYEILMKKYPLPLLKWWGKPILSYALKEGLIKPIISHMPFPPFPLGAAVGLFGYGSPLCCGCARTVCQFRAVEYA